MKNAKDQVYSLKITGYHIIRMTRLKDATPRTLHSDLVWEKSCATAIVQSQFEGHESSFEFFIDAKSGFVPPSFDQVLGDSPDDIQKLVDIYGPIFKNAQLNSGARHHTIPFFGSDGYAGVDKTDPVAIVRATMKIAQASGLAQADRIGIVKVGNSP